MPKYHISPETGRPNICRANVRDCPVGGEHYETKEDAREGYENLQGRQIGHQMSKGGVRGSLPTPELKSASDDKTEALAKLTDADRAVATTYGLRYEKDGPEAVLKASQRLRANLASLRSLEEKLGGEVVVTNGGAYQRFKAAGSQWTMQLQGDSEGKTYVRIFNAGVPVYGDHSRDKAWTFEARQNIAQHVKTVEKLYTDFINAAENQAREPMWG